MRKENTLEVKDFPLDCGILLHEANFSFTTYGTYDRNAVLIFHALTGNSNAADWWSGLIGEGKAIDPEKSFIISVNFLGSCYGSTGPESIDPLSGKPYHSIFPIITIADIARQHLVILDSLGIGKVSIGIGGSMGGMVLLELALLAPNLFEKIIPIAVAASHSAWRLAFSTTIRKIIEAFGEQGFEKGLFLARHIAMTSYRSSTEFNNRFGRDMIGDSFEVEHYLEHQGKKIAERFSPYSYLTLTRAMELYDITDRIREITCKAHFIGIDSDILYKEDEICEVVSNIPNATYSTLVAPFGHDSFLVAQDKLANLILPFLNISNTNNL